MKKYLLFFLLSFSVLLVHGIHTRHAIYGDGNGYYSTSLSLLTEGTFNAPSVLNHLRNFPGRDYTFSRIFWDESKNPYSIGTSLFWLPALAIARLITPSSFSLILELAPGVTGIILILSGLYFIEQYLLHFYPAKPVFYTILTLYLGSNIFYYSSFEPALSHQPSFFLVAFLLYWTYDFTYSKINLFILGLLFGLLHITRIADTLMLIPIIFTLKLDFKKLLIIASGGLLAMAPQLLAQTHYYGSIFRNFYVTESPNVWSFAPLNLYNYLFSLKKGLFIWSPLFLVGIYGLIKRHSLTILLTILGAWCLGSFWSTASSMTAGFGQRLSFAAIPYFALGIAYVYTKLQNNARVFYTSLFVSWNIFLTYGFYILKWKNL